MRSALLLAVTILATGGTWADDLPKTPAGKLVASPRILVIAHRGDSQVAPENTLPAFASAVKAGADMVELDYVHTADEIPLVIHDHTLDRTTDAKERWQAEKIDVHSKKLDELAELDAGLWFGESFRGTKLPTLDQALDVIQNGSVTLIERKGGDAKTCIDLLEKKEMVGDVVVQAFDWDYLKDCRDLRKDLALGALGSGALTEEKLDAIEAAGANVVGWHFSTLRAKQIKDIHDRGMKAWAWTVDKPEIAERLIEFGIDGIITNVPAEMKEVVAEKSKAAASSD